MTQEQIREKLSSCHKTEMKYSDEKIMATLDRFAFPKGLSIFQTLKMTYWSLFDKKKVCKFIEEIENGEEVYFAFKNAAKIHSY